MLSVLKQHAYSPPVRALRILVNETIYGAARIWWPALDRGTFYARSMHWLIAHGFRQKTLGHKVRARSGIDLVGTRFSSTIHADFGRGDFERLRSFGIEPHHTIVDYGCGTLRVGRHFVRYLAKGRYWGLDLIPEYLEMGRELAARCGLARADFDLRVISAASLAECAAANPDYIVSTWVMQLVPPDCLGAFFDNIVRIAGPTTSLLLHLDTAPESLRTSGASWAYSQDHIMSIARTRFPGHRIAFETFGERCSVRGMRINKTILVVEAVRRQDGSRTDRASLKRAA